jgi:hypothetical protein
MLKLLAALALPAAVIAMTGFGTTLFKAEPSGTPWVVWDGRGFANPDELARWLDDRGVRYSTWAQQHPLAAARLENREPPPLPAKATSPKGEPSAARPEAPAQATPKTVSVTTADRAGGSIVDELLLLLLLALAAALVAVAVLPLPLLRTIRVPELVGDLRLELAFAGVSIVIGVAAARLLTGA